jgi:hypothetical protein
MHRFIGEMRRERSTIKRELENQPTVATKERLNASRQTVDELRIELERSDQKLRSAEGALRSRELAETPQAHLGRLIKGVDQPSGTKKEMQHRRDQLLRLVPRYLPDIDDAVRRTKFDLLTLHQDAFAAGYHADEYTLLGMVVKYAGEFNIAVSICGSTGETFNHPLNNDPPPPRPRPRRTTADPTLHQDAFADGFRAAARKHQPQQPDATPAMTRQSEPIPERHWLLRLLLGPRTGK